MKRLNSKFAYLLIGLFAGLMLSFTFTAAASGVSFFGKKIDGEYTVTINGKELPVKAGTIEGTSLLPVRVVSEAFGAEVGFDETTGITLTTKKEEATMAGVTTPDNNTGESKEVYTKSRIESEITVFSINISSLKSRMLTFPKEFDTKENRDLLAEYEANLKVWKGRLAELGEAGQ